MTTEDHKTFNILDALTGRTFPKDKVKVHQDAATDFLIAQSNETVSNLRAVNETEQAQELEKKIDDLIKEAESSALTVHVQAISDDERDLLVDASLSKYPEELDTFGRRIDNDDRNRHFTNMLWAAHITQIEAAGGVDTEIDINKVVAIRSSLPDYSKREIARVIDGLYAGANQGYQQAVQEVGFSSAASLEA